MTAIYSSDLAAIHHADFTSFARAAAPGVLELLRDAGVTHGRVVDLACGSGVWTRELSAAGYAVVGVDRSTAMLAIARRVAPQARFIHADLRRAPIPRCDAITCLGEGLSYGTARQRRRPDLAPVLRRLYRVLEPGGVFVFDLVVGPLVPPLTPAHRHYEGADWALLLDVERGTRADQIRRRMTVFRRHGAAYRRTVETHHLWVYPRSTVRAALRDTGFSVRRLRGYGDVALLPGRAAYFARKRS